MGVHYGLIEGSTSFILINFKEAPIINYKQLKNQKQAG